MAEKRREPFVAWMWNVAAEWGDDGEAIIYRDPHDDGDEYDELSPVVVTPLLPDDPRIGETWLWRSGPSAGWISVTIESAPLPWNVEHAFIVLCEDGERCLALLSDLRRPPVLKTYRLPLTDGVLGWGKAARDSYISVSAESRDAALAKLAEMLEEVEP